MAIASARIDRFRAGDPLRAVAALSVLIFHAVFGVPQFAGIATPDELNERFGAAAGALNDLDLGLYIFFALSGYLLSRPFVVAIAAGSPLPSVRPYLRNRFLRIVPAFWVVAALTLIVFGPYDDTFGELISIPLFAQNVFGDELAFRIGQAWTLDVEMHFYLLLPVAAAAAALLLRGIEGSRRRLALMAVTVLLAAAASVAARALGPQTFAWLLSLPACLFGFMPGIALAVAECRVLPSPRLRRACSRAAWALLVVAAAGFVVSARLLDDPEVAHALLAMLVSGGLVGAALARQWGGRPAWRVLDNRLMHWLGVRSYGIYLVHLGVLFQLASLSEPGSDPLLLVTWMTPAAIMLSVAGAAALHVLVERPALALRESWRNSASRSERATST